MRLISRHILRTMVAPFLWGVVALTGMLLLNSLPPLIEKFGGKGIDLRTIAQCVLLLTPSLLALTLPMAVLVSVLYGYSQLAANLELVAMYANGISVWRMARPALVGALVVALGNFYVFDQLMPKSNVQLVNLTTAVTQKWPTLALRQRVLNVLPARPGYILRADAIEPETGDMRKVTIFDLTDNLEQVRRLIVADSGNMAETATGDDLVLTLHSGEIYEFKPNDPGHLQQINFDHNVVIVRGVQNSLDVSSAGHYRGEKELSGCELLDQLDEQRWRSASTRQESEYFTRSDLHVLAGLPLPVRPATPPMPKFKEHCGAPRRALAWLKGLVLPRKLAAQNPPQKPPPQQFLVPPGPQQQPGGFLTPPFNVKNNDLMIGGEQSAILLYEVELHQKVAVPLACFCFVLIGMALALKYPGGGIGLVIGGSLVIFLGFYILLQGGRGVALAGQLNPAIAMYVPLLLFTIIGLVAVNSANREMGTARSGGILDTLMGLFQGGRD